MLRTLSRFTCVFIQSEACAKVHVGRFKIQKDLNCIRILITLIGAIDKTSCEFFLQIFFKKRWLHSNFRSLKNSKKMTRPGNFRRSQKSPRVNSFKRGRGAFQILLGGIHIYKSISALENNATYSGGDRLYSLGTEADPGSSGGVSRQVSAEGRASLLGAWGGVGRKTRPEKFKKLIPQNGDFHPAF